jgi:hypothetical protein
MTKIRSNQSTSQESTKVSISNLACSLRNENQNPLPTLSNGENEISPKSNLLISKKGTEDTQIDEHESHVNSEDDLLHLDEIWEMDQQLLFRATNYDNHNKDYSTIYSIDFYGNVWYYSKELAVEFEDTWNKIDKSILNGQRKWYFYFLDKFISKKIHENNLLSQKIDLLANNYGQNRDLNFEIMKIVSLHQNKKTDFDQNYSTDCTVSEVIVNHVYKCRKKGATMIRTIFTDQCKLILQALKSMALIKKKNDWDLTSNSIDWREDGHLQFIQQLDPKISHDWDWAWIAVELYYRSWLVDVVCDDDDWILDIYDESMYFQ